MRNPNPPDTAKSPQPPPATPATAAPEAEVFGPYLVFERIGVGGMASVHRAKKRGIEGFERVTALKRLLPHLAEDISFVRSFVREAKLASLLQHANIVQLHELGRVAETYFIAMEYVDGYDLRRLLKQARAVAGPPPPGVVVGILSALCDALDYAHNRKDDATGEPLGLVHRDVSPSNVIVSHGGHIKVLDFGIAKATSTQFKTETGRVKGKLGYMSPEAVQGLDLDARSDIFSAGTVAYELLTAAPLFASRNEYDTLNRITRETVPPPSSLNPTVPAALDEVVLKALSKRPEDRFANAAAMREALDHLTVSQKLITGPRQVADWLGWAFNLDPEGDRPGPYREPGAPTPHARASVELPVAEADDEVVEIAWGGRNPSTSPPVIVGGVPDVSDQIPYSMSSQDDVDILGVGPTPPGRLARGTTPPPRIREERSRRSQTLPLMPLPEHAEVVGDASVDEDIPTDTISRIDPAAALADGEPDEPTAPTGPMVTFSDGEVYSPPPTSPEPLVRSAAPQLAVIPEAKPHRVRVGTTVTTGPVPRTVPRNQTWQLPALRDDKRRPVLAIGGGVVLGIVVALLGLAFGGSQSAARVTFALAPTGPQTRVTVGGQALAGHDIELAPGAYDILITRRGYDDWSGRIDVGEGERHTVHVKLTVAAAAEGAPAAETKAVAAVPATAGTAGEETRPAAAPLRERRATRKKEPGTVAFDSLHKVGGKAPFLREDDRAQAKLCVDKRGRVKSVQVLKEPRRSSSRRFAKELRAWRFAPVEIEGTAVPVCTVVTIRS